MSASEKIKNSTNEQQEGDTAEPSLEEMADTIITEWLHIPRMPSPVSGAYKLSSIGKLFFASLIVTLTTGKASPFRVSGRQEDIQILARAIQSSKRFQDEIHKPGATIDSVIRSMDLKNVDGKNFQARFGVPWPL
jgi:hypothetical protein